MAVTTDIQNFYKNKSVFLTGGTGFLGKVFIEKLLRGTEVDRIYILARGKKGKSMEERIGDLFLDPLFDKLHAAKPEAHKRVVPISGDCILPNLALSPKDVETLIENVQIVVHSAATVRFNELLSTAVAINLQATVDLLKLAKQMQRLEAFVHVSSAFANCLEPHLEERYYVDNVGISSKEMCALSQTVSTDVLNLLSKVLGKNFPNTYCFTKALAEDAVLSGGRDLPICIFRPGIVVSVCEGPIPGWIDNMYGPTSILYGAAHGILRVIYADNKTNSCIVPVDYCANMMIACAWRTAKEKYAIPPRIYHLVPDMRNVVNWSEYKKSIEIVGVTMPLSRMLWFPFLYMTNSKFMYYILQFLYHTIPGYIYDFIFLLLGKRRRMTKLYRKIHKQTMMLEHFVKINFTFSMENTLALWNSMSEMDQRLFRFDMLTIEWRQYFENSLKGMRRFLGKEDPETIPKAISLLKRLYILHRAVQCLVCGGGLTLVYWICSKMFKNFLIS